MLNPLYFTLPLQNQTNNEPENQDISQDSGTTDKDRGAKGTEGLLRSSWCSRCIKCALPWNSKGHPWAGREQSFMWSQSAILSSISTTVWHRKIFTTLVVFDSDSWALVNHKSIPFSSLSPAVASRKRNNQRDVGITRRAVNNKPRGRQTPAASEMLAWEIRNVRWTNYSNNFQPAELGILPISPAV